MAARQEAQAQPARPALAWGISLWTAVAVLFLFLAILASFYDRFPSDERIAHAIQGIDVPVFGGFMSFINAVGDAWINVPLTLAAAAILVWRRAWFEAVLVLVTFLPRGFNSLIKEMVARPRPSPELVEVSDGTSGYSFPSGHTVATAVLFAALFFLIPSVVPSRPVRWVLQAGCLLAIAAAGPARVYAGVHWPSDALGGYLLALLFLIPLVALYFRFRRGPAEDSTA